VLIVGVAYFLEEVGGEFIKRNGESWLKIYNIHKPQLIVGVAVLLVSFVLSRFLEGKIDSLLLPKYKWLLTRIISDRCTRLWTFYNSLLTIHSEATRALFAVAESRRNLFAASSSSTKT
jgi:hypothetical protein